jgi:ribosomal protein S21
MTIQVTRRDGESGEKLLKRFSGHIKSTRIIYKFRGKRYFAQTPRKNQVRQAAVVREAHRVVNKKKKFLAS